MLFLGGDPNLRTLNGSTLLIEAVKHNQREFLPILLDHPDLDINLTNSKGETALSLAVQMYPAKESTLTDAADNGKGKTAKGGTKATGRGKRGQGPRKGKEKVEEKEQMPTEEGSILSLLLRTEGHSIASLNRAFFYAMLMKDADTIDTLLHLGADIDSRGPWYNKTALMVAAETRDASAVHFLLDRGADVHLIDDYQHTALDLARLLAATEIVSVLRGFSLDKLEGMEL